MGSSLPDEAHASAPPVNGRAARDIIDGWHQPLTPSAGYNRCFGGGMGDANPQKSRNVQAFAGER
jgi:hypothetical protein